LGKIPTSEGWRREKKRKYLQRVQVAGGSGRMEGDQGGGNGGGGAWWVVVVVLVHSKSKIKCAPLSIVLF